MNNKLARNTQLFGAVIIGLGSILGTGAYVSVGLTAAIAGDLLIWAIVIAAFTALCNGLSSAQLASAHPVSGGTYEYGYQYLNRPCGVAAGVLFIVAKSASAATAALVIADYLASVMGLGDTAEAITSITLLLFFTVFVLAGLRRTNWLNGLLVCISLLGLLVFVMVAFQAEPSGELLHREGSLSLFHGAALMFVAFTGYGRIATMGEEIAHPRKNIPRAVWLTLIVVSIIYILVGMAIVHIWQYKLLLTSDFNIANLVNHSPWRWVVVGGGVVAMGGVILNLVLGVSRVYLAMGRRGDLPASLATLDKDNKAAPMATWATFFTMALIVLLGGIESTWTLSAFTVLIYYSITNVAALKVSQAQRFIPRWVSVLGLLSCVSLVVLAVLAQ
ncbi:APC family permease [Aestuariibacter sp. A3R04]|uniref:APC family permease n=1 Tax=Aestuariibacter sp. A3R04 TaxID=2841571 RepID=UPI001C09E9D1|nr:APC family permease [Aestuariibacter sp. A3R04]MBU3021223.1 APC family permease [Aestuariibacter sp. A3R04]